MENVFAEVNSPAESIAVQLKNFHRCLRHVPEPEARVYYEDLRALLGDQRFDGLYLKNGEIRQDAPQKAAEKTAAGISVFTGLHGEEAEHVYLRVQILRSYDFEQFWQLYNRRIIVSVTSYPARIAYVGTALKSILAQTLPADEVVLYLAAEQFPKGEESLPDELRQMIASGEVTLKWCADLKPHKKYFYAFQDYPEALVVTIDDDLLYAAELLEQLLDTHLRFPHAVTAGRVHLMTFGADGGVLPYIFWIQETDASLFVPSMQLFATGGAGALYPPHLLPKEMLDENAVRKTSLLADDLWLKAMEAMADVPVVLCCHRRPLTYVPGSQEEALWKENIDGGSNDRQLAQIMAWTDTHYGFGTLQKKLCSKDVGVNLQGAAEIRRHMRVKQERMIDLSRYLYARLDLKNTGNAANDLEILSLSDDRTTVQTPAWFQENGRGYVFRAKEGLLRLAFRCKGDGELSFTLRGPDAGKIAGRRMPVWVEYRAFLVDEQTVLPARKSVWHDRPYRYSMPVRDGQIVSVQLEWTADFAVLGSGHSILEEEIKASRLAEQEQRKRNKEQERQIQELEQELKEQKAQTAGLKQENAELNERIALLRQEKAESNEKIARLRQQRAESNEKIARLRQQRAKSNEKIVRLKQENAESNEKIARLRQQRAESNEKIVRLKQENAESNERIAHLRQQRTELKEKISRLRQQRDAAIVKNDCMKASLSWKIGRAVTWLPRKIRNMLKRAH